MAHETREFLHKPALRILGGIVTVAPLTLSAMEARIVTRVHDGDMLPICPHPEIFVCALILVTYRAIPLHVNAGILHNTVALSLAACKLLQNTILPYLRHAARRCKALDRSSSVQGACMPSIHPCLSCISDCSAPLSHVIVLGCHISIMLGESATVCGLSVHLLFFFSLNSMSTALS